MKIQISILMLILHGMSGCAQNVADQSVNPFYRTLTSEEKNVIIYKGTERPFTGKYDKFNEAGIYVCKRCGAELYKSISLEFIPARVSQGTVRDTAYFAGGCFWGVEYYMEQANGVISVESGYMGGRTENPDYREAGFLPGEKRI